MEQIGVPLNPETCLNFRLFPRLLKKLFTSLNTIHASGYFHGDARIYNAVVVDDEVVWVDFVAGGRHIFEDNEREVSDMETLMKSIFGPDVVKSGEVVDLLGQYNEHLDNAVASAIADLLQQSSESNSA
mmetsp:Transcript_10104/g.12260  ORF Transcript_10104/g.12260 Transcript_10104/m.12260 type:complete len:129 (-) Transcript_10104:92-478(-)